MSFKVGDHIYKIINGTEDPSVKYRILQIHEEESGNWHDGYSTTWKAIIQVVRPNSIQETPEMTENYILKHNQWGSYHLIYASLDNKNQYAN
jgi:hypothetical protein